MLPFLGFSETGPDIVSHRPDRCNNLPGSQLPLNLGGRARATSTCRGMPFCYGIMPAEV
jgi:hypothetical protein